MWLSTLSATAASSSASTLAMTLISSGIDDGAGHKEPKTGDGCAKCCGLENEFSIDIGIAKRQTTKRTQTTVTTSTTPTTPTTATTTTTSTDEMTKLTKIVRKPKLKNIHRAMKMKFKTRSSPKQFSLYTCSYLVLFGCPLLLLVLLLPVSTFSFNIDDSRAVGRSAHEPKFGERLLPLSRKKSTNLRSLSKNNYFVANVAGGEKANLHLPAAELYTLDTTPTEDVDEFALRPRQAKQLNRREDTDVIADQAAFVAPLIAAAAANNVSKADRLIVEMSTEFFVVPTTSATPPAAAAKSAIVGAKTRVVNGVNSESIVPRSVLIVAPMSKGSKNNNNSSSSSGNTATPPTIVSTYPSTAGFTGLRKEPWVVPVLVLAALTMLMMGAFEIFVLFKAWRTSPSRRHLFLGQMLLLGLFACAGLGAIITAQPSLLSCGTIRFGVGVSYALVFAALLVKCVFLISLNGGVYLPAPYQGLLLLFAVLIQVAIGAQWLLTQPPEIYTLNVPIVGSGLLATTVASSTLITTSAAVTAAAVATTASSSAYATLFHPANAELYTRVSATGTVLIPLCKTQFSELLLSLIYIIFLIVFVAVLAIKSRGIRDNYREATYIGLAIGGAIPIWLGWTLCGLAVAERHKDACIAFGLVATSATVFLVMFMPKGRQLAAMGKEGLYVEDREEQFSSLSRAGSGYSPSFFHFKPIKYGVMSGGDGGGGLQHSSSNTGNGTSAGKHCSNGGDRVALVSAAPPSYTRMYHYFPAPPLPPTHHHHHHHPFCYYPQPPPAMPAPPPPLPLPLPPPPLPTAQIQTSPTALTPQAIAHLAQHQQHLHHHHHQQQQHQQQQHHQQVTPLPLPPPPQALNKNKNKTTITTTKKTKSAQLTQLVATPPTLKQLGNSLATMTQAHLAQTLRYPGLFIRPDETNLYTTLEPTLSSNPNVYFQRGGAVHPGMMY